MTEPTREGPAQKLVCPYEKEPLIELSSRHEGSELVSRTYTCNGPDGHVWIDAIGGDGFRTWREDSARTARLPL